MSVIRIRMQMKRQKTDECIVGARATNYVVACTKIYFPGLKMTEENQ